ncbi:MAG TPA: response regulator [Thermoanaerobaculia bacterium]|nr:response regulator [Thermoanaerobaculia bacterium]
MTSDQKRVLVVDDDSDIRKLLAAILRQRELIVDTASDGNTALALVRDQRYAVVLLDLFMPGMDGFEVLRALKEDEMSAPVVLVVTGADRQTIARLDAAGIHGIVRKPFDPDELASLVLACSEIRSRGAFGPMAIATVISGAQMLQWLVRS